MHHIFMVIAVSILSITASATTEERTGYTIGPVPESTCTTFRDAFWCPTTFLCTIVPSNATVAQQHCNRLCAEAARLKAQAVARAEDGSASFLGYGSAGGAGVASSSGQGSGSGDASDASGSASSAAYDDNMSTCTDFTSCQTCASNEKTCGDCMFAGGTWQTGIGRCFPMPEMCNDTEEGDSCIDDDANCPACDRYSPPITCLTLFPAAVSVLVAAFFFAIVGSFWAIYHWGKYETAADEKDETTTSTTTGRSSKSSTSGKEESSTKRKRRDDARAAAAAAAAADVQVRSADDIEQPLLQQQRVVTFDSPVRNSSVTASTPSRPVVAVSSAQQLHLAVTPPVAAPLEVLKKTSVASTASPRLLTPGSPALAAPAAAPFEGTKKMSAAVNAWIEDVIMACPAPAPMTANNNGSQLASGGASPANNDISTHHDVALDDAMKLVPSGSRNISTRSKRSGKHPKLALPKPSAAAAAADSGKKEEEEHGE